MAKKNLLLKCEFQGFCAHHSILSIWKRQYWSTWINEYNASTTQLRESNGRRRKLFWDTWNRNGREDIFDQEKKMTFYLVTYALFLKSSFPEQEGDRSLEQLHTSY